QQKKKLCIILREGSKVMKNDATQNKTKKKSPISFNWITKWGIVISIIALIIVFTIMLPNLFLTKSNMIDILRSISITTIIAIGVTISISVDGLDLSVGSTATLASSLIISFFVWYNMPAGIAIPLALLLTLV